MDKISIYSILFEIPGAYPPDVTPRASGHHGATYYEHAAFLDRIEARAAGAVETSAAATPEQGLWSMLVASAAQESSRTGEAVSVDATLIANGLDSLLK